MRSRMSTTSPLTAIQKLIQGEIHPENSVAQTSERLQGHFHHVQLGKLADGGALVLKHPSNLSIRSLRHEIHSLESEYRLIRTLQEHTQLPVPEVVDYDGNGNSFGSPYLLTAHTPGQRLSEALPYLSAVERKNVDRMLGSIAYTLASLTSLQFGPINDVHKGKGCESWREAFLAFFESALRDAEDMLITLPYEFLRDAVGRHSHSLDVITEPRLVAFDICNPENVLVNEHTRQATCLVGLSNVIWGDPLMGDAVANGSVEFRQGCESLFRSEEGSHIRKSM